MNTIFTTMTRRGQITVSAKTRHRLGLKPKDKVAFHFSEDEIVRLEPMEMSLEETLGSVRPVAEPTDYKKVARQVKQEHISRTLLKRYILSTLLGFVLLGLPRLVMADSRAPSSVFGSTFYLQLFGVLGGYLFFIVLSLLLLRWLIRHRGKWWEIIYFSFLVVGLVLFAALELIRFSIDPIFLVIVRWMALLLLIFFYFTLPIFFVIVLRRHPEFPRWMSILVKIGAILAVILLVAGALGFLSPYF